MLEKDKQRAENYEKVKGYIDRFHKKYIESVLSKARIEKVNEYDLFNLESAAILHDIGIKVCEKKYNSTEGKLQEKEGPAVAREILENLDYKNINRILFLIGHHHTYINVSGLDYQILIEADLLVNFEEENTSKEDIKKVYENIFKTKTGKKFCREIFDISL